MNNVIVKLNYFHTHGKYYANGEYETSKIHHHEIIDEVVALIKQRAPGLMGPASRFNTYVQPIAEDGTLMVPHVIPATSLVRSSDTFTKSADAMKMLKPGAHREFLKSLAMLLGGPDSVVSMQLYDGRMSNEEAEKELLKGVEQLVLKLVQPCKIQSRQSLTNEADV